MAADDWTLVIDGWDPADEGRREAILTLGNGRFAEASDGRLDPLTWGVVEGYVLVVLHPSTLCAVGRRRADRPRCQQSSARSAAR